MWLLSYSFFLGGGVVSQLLNVARSLENTPSWNVAALMEVMVPLSLGAAGPPKFIPPPPLHTTR